MERWTAGAGQGISHGWGGDSQGIGSIVCTHLYVSLLFYGFHVDTKQFLMHFVLTKGILSPFPDLQLGTKYVSLMREVGKC